VAGRSPPLARAGVGPGPGAPRPERISRLGAPHPGPLHDKRGPDSRMSEPRFAPLACKSTDSRISVEPELSKLVG